MPNGEQLKTSVVFHCPDVEATCRNLETAVVQITMQPASLPWGMFATFVDLDGNEFGLTSQALA
jgi:predicted enzyme related to lactoylglutathione lyase